jgi:hypothetical protein
LRIYDILGREVEQLLIEKKFTEYESAGRQPACCSRSKSACPEK